MADIRAEVANALHWEVAVPRNRVTANVREGWVTLNGTVERPYEKTCAEAVVRRVRGVVGVHNEIAVSRAPADQPARHP